MVFIQVTPKYEFAWLKGNEQLGKTTIEGINDKAQNASQMLNFTCKSNNASTGPVLSAELVHSVQHPNSKTCPNIDSDAPWVRQVGDPCKKENFGYDLAYARTPTVRTPTTCKPMSNVRLFWRESVHPRFVKQTQLKSQ